MEICKEGGLHVESVLKYFPDFVYIDTVKEELIEALQTYQKELDDLGKELDESANSSELIRQDIKNLAAKY